MLRTLCLLLCLVLLSACAGQPARELACDGAESAVEIIRHYLSLAHYVRKIFIYGYIDGRLLKLYNESLGVSAAEKSHYIFSSVFVVNYYC